MWSRNTSWRRPASHSSQFVIKAHLIVPISALVMAKPANGAILTSYHLVLIVDVARPDELLSAGSRRWRNLKLVFVFFFPKAINAILIVFAQAHLLNSGLMHSLLLLICR